MGYFMASNLATYLFENKKPSLRVWNRTNSKSENLVKESKGKAIAVDTLKEIATTCDVIISSLANDDVVKNVYKELLGSIPRDGKTIIFVETSTVYPTVTGGVFFFFLFPFNQLFIPFAYTCVYIHAEELEKQVKDIEGCSFISCK